jgi:hypothetical protein
MPRNVPRRPASSAPPRRANAPASLVPLPLAHPAHLAAIAAALACVALVVLVRLQDTDLWQHLAVGRAIWSTHAVPTTQVWSWPTYGAPDVNSSWGFELLLWPFWSAGSIAGLTLWRVLTAWLAFGLAWALARRMGARGLAPLVVCALAALVVHRRLQVRPETWALVLFAASLLVLEVRRRGDPRTALWLAPIALAWVNSHISWPFAFVNALLHLADEALAGRSRRAHAGWLAAALALALAASCVNPFGLAALAQPFTFLAHDRGSALFRAIPELQPLDWSRNLRTGLPLLIVAGAILVLARVRGRFGLGDRVGVTLFVLYLVLGVRMQRFISFFALAAAPYVARDADAWLAALRRPVWGTRAWGRAGAAIAACATLLVLRTADPAEPISTGFDPYLQPAAACDFIAAHGVRGRSFNHFWIGGYLLHRFWPEKDRLPFMDVHQSGGPDVQREYLAALRDSAGWTALRDRRAIDWALLWRVDVPGDRSVESLDGDSTFRLVHLDDVSALYVRRRGPLAAIADSFGYAVLRSSPARFGPLMRAAAADTALRAALHAELERAAAGAALNTWASRWRDETADHGPRAFSGPPGR